MSTVIFIDEPTTHREGRRTRTTCPDAASIVMFSQKEITMNARILFTATLAIALVSSLALAGEPQPAATRASVVADLQKARADGTLRKNDYDYDAHDFGTQPGRARQDVIAEMRAPRDKLLVGVTARNRTYNPYGSELLRMQTVPRAQVKADVLTAMRDGSLRRSDYDDVPVRATRRHADPAAAPILAGVADRATVAR